MCHTERWMSGLNQRFTKPSSLKQDREFESRSLRHNFCNNFYSYSSTVL